MNKLKRLGLIGVLVAIINAPFKEAWSVNGYLKYIHPIENAREAYVEPNIFYQLQNGISGYTWIDFLQGDVGYYGKSNLEKKVALGLNAKVQGIHSNSPLSKAGVGFSTEIPKLPKSIFAKLGLLPLWFDANGVINNEVVLEYFVTKSLPYGFNVSSFGDWNLTSKGGVQWGYGEIEIQRKTVNGIKLSYNLGLLNKGGSIPKVQHRIAITVGF